MKIDCSSSCAGLLAPWVLVLGACSAPEPSASQGADRAAAAKLATIESARETTDRNLATFDDLDFNIYTNQRWEEFTKSHAADIVVHYPDGHTTEGLEAHIAELKPQFVFAPDTRIKVHPIRVAQGNFTAVTGIMEGAFSRPMLVPGGKSIAPTGKTFRLEMATVGRWENGVMKEEWLFWDNQSFMKQIGLAK